MRCHEVRELLDHSAVLLDFRRARRLILEVSQKGNLPIRGDPQEGHHRSLAGFLTAAAAHVESSRDETCPP